MTNDDDDPDYFGVLAAYDLIQAQRKAKAKAKAKSSATEQENGEGMMVEAISMRSREFHERYGDKVMEIIMDTAVDVMAGRIQPDPAARPSLDDGQLSVCTHHWRDIEQVSHGWVRCMVSDHSAVRVAFSGCEIDCGNPACDTVHLTAVIESFHEYVVATKPKPPRPVKLHKSISKGRWFTG